MKCICIGNNLIQEPENSCFPTTSPVITMAQDHVPQRLGSPLTNHTTFTTGMNQLDEKGKASWENTRPPLTIVKKTVYNNLIKQVIYTWLPHSPTAVWRTTHSKECWGHLGSVMGTEHRQQIVHNFYFSSELLAAVAVTIAQAPITCPLIKEENGVSIN